MARTVYGNTPLQGEFYSYEDVVPAEGSSGASFQLASATGTAPSGSSADMNSNASIGEASFNTVAKPSSLLSTGNAIVLPTPLTGFFPAETFDFGIGAARYTNNTHAINWLLRLFKSSSITGSNPTALSPVLSTNASGLGTGVVAFNTTWTPTAPVELYSEYLFLAVACRLAAGTTTITGGRYAIVYFGPKTYMTVPDLRSFSIETVGAIGI